VLQIDTISRHEHICLGLRNHISPSRWIVEIDSLEFGKEHVAPFEAFKAMQQGCEIKVVKSVGRVTTFLN
jgi:hypothetical protein